MVAEISDLEEDVADQVTVAGDATDPPGPEGDDDRAGPWACDADELIDECRDEVICQQMIMTTGQNRASLTRHHPAACRTTP